MKNKTYKKLYIRQHGKAAYIKKLEKNAAWRLEHPDIIAQYSKERIAKAGSDSKTVLFIGDVHLGAKSVDVDKIKALSKSHWSRNPIILMGDLIDMGLKTKGMVFQNKMGPQEQMNLVKEIFKPLDVRAYCIGNHEDRIFQEVGLNPYIDIFGMDPTNNIEINGKAIFFNHGKSAAENAFLEHLRYARWVKGEIIALGHSHLLAKKTVYRQGRLTTFIRTGGFLGREFYVVQGGFPPQPKGWAEFDTVRNIVNLKGVTEEGEVFNL